MAKEYYLIKWIGWSDEYEAYGEFTEPSFGLFSSKKKATSYANSLNQELLKKGDGPSKDDDGIPVNFYGITPITICHYKTWAESFNKNQKVLI